MRHAVLISSLIALGSISGVAFAQEPPPPSTVPLSPAPADDDAKAAPQPLPPPAPAAAPADAVPAKTINVEFTSLRIMREKGVISQDEYDSAVKDIEQTSGLRKADGSTVVVGKFATSIYGFVEADYIHDTTQSFNDMAGTNPVARSGTYAGDNGRTTFGARNSRIGIRSKAPEFAGIRASAQLEMDFLGAQLPVGVAQPFQGSEAAFFTNPTVRMRHGNLKLETPIVDVLLGQYWNLIGFGSTFNPNTVAIQGVPGELYARNPQLRVSKTIKTNPVDLEIAVAAIRSSQRDSEAPDGQGGIRLAINQWKGVHTMGSTGTGIVPAQFAISGDVRHVQLQNFAAAPNGNKQRSGGTIAFDALLPILPGDKGKMANSLTFFGEFSSGYGNADLYTQLNGGVAGGNAYPALTNPTAAAPSYLQFADIDNGIAAYDSAGGLHLIQWTSYIFGAEYYLPGLDGRVWISANYSHQNSNNTANYGAKPTAVIQAIDWADGNIFADITPAVRLGFEYSTYINRYADNIHATNNRVQLSGFYIF